VLYLPFAKLLCALVPEGAFVLPLQLASNLPAALGVGGNYLLMRALGAPRLGAAAGAALVGLAPAYTFFATAVEVHGLHAGVAPFALLAVLCAPWRNRALSLLIAALAMVLLYGTHQTGALLGLGVVLMCGVGARNSGRPFTWPGLIFGVGPALFLALVAAMGAAALYRFGVFDPRLELQGSMDLAQGAAAGVTASGLDVVWLVVWPLALVLPLGLLGIVRARPPALECAVLAALVVLPWMVIALWGVVESGAYFLATLGLLIWPLARIAPARPTMPVWGLALLLIAVQGVLGVRRVTAWDQGYQLADRVALVEEVFAAAGAQAPFQGWLVSFTGYAPSIRLWFPTLRETGVGQALAMAGAGGATPADADGATASLEVLLGPHPVVIDTTYLADWPRVRHTPFAPYLKAAADGIEARYELRRFQRGSWHVWLVEGVRKP